MQDLRITTVQANLVWEDKQANLLHFEKLLDKANPKTDVIILPEMFATGFSMNAAKHAEQVDGQTISWMKKMSIKHQAVVTGSVITQDKGRYYNRLYWVLPDGNVESYDKRHLFSFADEEKYYSAGSSRLIVEFKGWRICPLVCYDLRFPVWSRNIDFNDPKAATAYDLLIYVANWPEARRRPWLTLLEARAHENQVYVAGVNRIGKDGNGINHTGDTGVYSPKGEIISKTEPSEESVETISLSFSELEEFREKFTVWKDKDQFDLKT